MKNIGRIKRVATLSFVLLSLVIAQLPVGGQTRRAGARREPTTSTSRTQQPPAETATSVLSSSARGRQMSVPFETGSLPEPLRKPQGSEDEVAATLGKLVSARDEKSVPALLAALMAAGLAVRDSDGSVMQTVQPGQGLVFEAWEVAAMGKMYGERKTVTLSYLSDGFKAIPALKGAPLATILLKGIRAHAQDNQSPLRFWARFIVELGHQADEPYDMLAESDPQSVRLDAIQSALIMRRLYGDFYGFGERSKQASRGFGGDKLRGVGARRTMADETQQGSLFISAALSEDAAPHFVKVRSAKSGQQTQQSSPCGELGKGDASTILDAGANILTTGWGELMGYLGAEKYAAFLNIANILLAYAKFIATYAALETEITVENPPLVRTWNTEAGGISKLTAKVTMNVGKWEQVNCIRTALNVATGLDFDLLSDGPLADVEVNWHLNEGGDQSLRGKEQIVGFKGGPRIQDAGTYAGIPGQGGIPVGNATRSKTDKDGLARVSLQGSPHVPWIAVPRVAVMKQAVVRTTIKLKGGDIKEDAVDIAGALAGFIRLEKGKGLSGSAGGWFTFPLELLYRTDWASTATITVPVKDWEPCDRGWSGTITVTGKLIETKDEMPGGPRGWSLSRITEVKRDFEYRFTLTGVKDTSEGFQNGYFADAQITINNSNVHVDKTTHGGFCDTGRRDARGSKITVMVKGLSTATNSLLLNGTGKSRTTVYIAERGAQGYNILINSPTPIAGTRKSELKVEFPQCPLWEQVNSHDPEERPETFYPNVIEFLATFDPKNPGVLSDSMTEKDGRSNGTITYKWDLQECK